MTTMPDWLQIYRHVDDDTLAALGSVGLVRRAAKDVEAGKVAWEAAPSQLRVDGQLVRIDAGGPARASCDCPAPGVCKHILAAAIWLRDAAAVPAPASAPDSAPASARVVAAAAADHASAAASAIDPLPALLAEVAALEPAAVFKAAGMAAARKAAALHQTTGAATVSATAGALLITLPSFELTCRYISGAGYAGMVSEAPPAARAVIHVLALAAVWRQQQRAIAWPAPTKAAAASAADTGGAADDTGLTPEERRFLQRLRQLVLAAFADGWSHVSEIVPAQLRALAMSARVESFPRLAGMLRTLAGTAQLLVERDTGVDERQAIRLATRIYALAQALEHSQGDRLRDLRGRERRSFDDNQALELLPLGAHWWEQRAGARGLTVSFWNPADQAIMQAVLARRDGADRNFNRAQAWSTTSLWQGAGAADTLANGALALEQVRVSADHRLSLSAETRASLLPPWTVTDARWNAAGYDDWRTLAAARSASAGLRGDAVDCVLLKPAQYDAPQLDEARQTFDWILRDRHGAPLALQLPGDAAYHRRIEHLGGWAQPGTPIRAVLARFERSLHGNRLEPLTLVIEDQGLLRAISLDYQARPAVASAPLLQRIARLFSAKPAGGDSHGSAAANGVFTPPAGDALALTLETLQRILENKGMSGRLHVPGEDCQQLEQLHNSLRACGVDLLADALRRYLDAPDTGRAVALIYLCVTCAEL